ncbi:peptidoglycan/xylan/chitin deacetylase (PgdA/CDA1 family) [Krasilnikovia cinnamomea]|uniref:Peptidoglycan/xylan/chitin deacetylase (PgdA/CDA1 family) n=1 Tax=Krasilnikovia cinnamomea TaxID=349313 RepID=A0A4Q7ZRP4_9ACTN|nr:polysaccharide deacetylase family protein [Krasilnikovia cinnamomea]RZU53165.1 peptidoglycan/xylan/chitin deacetylase (PgdA/CDA1 family) [Krasilnikovia cinnamomea]
MLALLMTLAMLVPGATAVPPGPAALTGASRRAVIPAPVTAAPVTTAPATAAARKTIALTFDDGPHPRYTPQVLNLLRKYHVKATFCIVGDNAARYPALVRRIRAEGHRLCNHTRNHANMTRLSNSAARKQITTAQRQIRAAAGVSPTVFRFPYGASNARVRAVVRDCGLRNLRWTVDTKDWERPAARTITARVLRGARPGAVVLMHDGGGNRSRTVASLDSTIRQLKHKGYTFVLG